MGTLFAPAFNLAVLIGILFYYLREPLKSFVQSRHVTLRDEILRVRELLRSAKEKYEEFSAKLKAIEAEVRALREQARQDAQGAKQRLLTEARRSSSMIVADARNAADSLYSELKGQLYGELGGRVLDRAEAMMRERLTGDDRARITEEFSKEVEGAR